ncbi:5912_t:CDS:1, partial [Racocetra fulgida]
LLDLLILRNKNHEVLSQNSSVSAPSQERNQDDITDLFKKLAGFNYCTSVTYKMQFGPFENDTIDYPGFDNFGKKLQQYFAIRDE